MRRAVFCLCSALLVTAPLAAAPPNELVVCAAEPAPARADRVAGMAAEHVAAIPVRFEANAGQTDDRVRFLARRGGASLFLTPTEAIFSLRGRGTRSRDAGGASADAGQGATAAVRVNFVGASPSPRIEGEAELPGRSTYLVGQNPAAWRADVPAYGRVRYSDIYPGIDLVYYGNRGELEFDFVVAPGADARLITMRFSARVRVDRGDLLLETAAGEIRQRAPVVFQETPEGRRRVGARYAVRGANTVGLSLAPYDRSRSLVIDPTLAFSTFLGGAGIDVGCKIAVDPSGAIYVVGETQSADFPAPNGADVSLGGTQDVFVAKLSATGDTLLYATFLGGSADEYGNDIAVDSTGAAYVTGESFSADFATPGAYDPSLDGMSDAFVAKLNPAGSSLAYATYLGGLGGETGYGIAVDSAGAAYVTGSTASSTFPTVNAYDGAFNGLTDAFVTKVAPAGDALVFSTYVGGTNHDLARGIALDSGLAVHIAGNTASADFPVGSAYDPLFNGVRDVFVTKLSATGNTLLYSTYLGGSAADYGNDVAVDASDSAYVAGHTASGAFPTVNAYDATYNGGVNDAFVAKLNAVGDGLSYSTFLGGSAADQANAVAVDLPGSAYVAGQTMSGNFPIDNAYDPSHGGGNDAFVTKLTPSGNALAYSTYFGDSGNDIANGVAASQSGTAYFAGQTSSATGFPARNAYDASFNGGTDAFIAKFVGPKGSDTAGVYYPPSGAWFLSNSNAGGPADIVFTYGPANASMVPISGDWDGDGDDTPGVFDPTSGAFFLKNTSGGGPADAVFSFGPGNAGFLPVRGDWNGDGADSIGIYNPGTSTFFLKNTNTFGPADLAFTYGPAGLAFEAIAGDWDGDGLDTIGLYNPADGAFFLKNMNAGGPADIVFTFGAPGATPLAGDWDASGTDTVGVYFGNTGAWFLRKVNEGGPADLVFSYGPAGSVPLPGDWNGL